MGCRFLDPLRDSGEGAGNCWKWGWLYVADSDTDSGCIESDVITGEHVTWGKREREMFDGSLCEICTK